ncbi:hypothetical protein OH76DRAFT_745581 [Lentinus brumalis]|uniref:Uncharacterized protein n=1 Tax=Lentinus brumalis TaxID=2498619 RepID=A0A371DSI1_9APHY|nr:hypothetical protein OH76DRAFT_745581 [Polyporus brumalis]
MPCVNASTRTALLRPHERTDSGSDPYPRSGPAAAIPRTESLWRAYSSVAHGGAHNSLRLAAHHRCCCALSPPALRQRPPRHQSVPPAHFVWTISLIHNGGGYWVLTSAQGRTRGSHHGIRVTTPPRRPQVHPKVLTTTHNRYSPTEAPRRPGRGCTGRRRQVYRSTARPLLAA